MSNYNKVLLKLDGNLEINNDYNLVNIFDLYDFIYYFGKLKYQINGTVKTQKIKFKEVKSSRVKNKINYYLEVLEEVQQAEKVSIIFQIRGQNYEYVLK